MSVFTESVQAWISNISINSVIMMIMMIFMLVGAIDKIRGNKLGYGEKFEEGWLQCHRPPGPVYGRRCGGGSCSGKGPRSHHYPDLHGHRC